MSESSDPEKSGILDNMGDAERPLAEVIDLLRSFLVPFLGLLWIKSWYQTSNQTFKEAVKLAILG